MELREWITLIIIPAASVITAAIAGIWAWYTGKYLPAKREEQARLISAALEETVDTREFKQASERSSLDTLIDNNKLMIEALLRYTDSDLKEILNELKSVRGELQKIAGNTSLQTREWSKIEETLSDIDIMFNRIEAILLGMKNENV